MNDRIRFRAARTSFLITLAFNLLLTLFVAPLFASTAPVSIPFTINADGFVVVPAKLEGTVAVQAILDTGAGVDIIAPSLLKKLHGKPEGQITGFRMRGDRVNIPLFRISELLLGSLLMKDVLVGTWDLLDKVGVEAILSMNDFREHPFTLDFIHKMLVLETPETLVRRRKEGASSTLQLDDYRGTMLDLFARFQLAGQSGQCVIDTGSPQATLNIRYMESLGTAKDAPNVRSREDHGGGVTQTRYAATLQEISLTAAPQVTLSKPTVGFLDIIYDCVIGIDFWGGKAVTIDIPHKELIAR